LYAMPMATTASNGSTKVVKTEWREYQGFMPETFSSSGAEGLRQGTHDGRIAARACIVWPASVMISR
jgi:hypothetical protein